MEYSRVQEQTLQQADLPPSCRLPDEDQPASDIVCHQEAQLEFILMSMMYHAYPASKPYISIYATQIPYLSFVVSVSSPGGSKGRFGGLGTLCMSRVYEHSPSYIHTHTIRQPHLQCALHVDANVSWWQLNSNHPTAAPSP